MARAGKSFYIGHISGGSLYYNLEYGEFHTLASVLEKAREIANRRNGVIIENAPAKDKLGKVYGTREIMRSAIDGEVLAR